MENYGALNNNNSRVFHFFPRLVDSDKAFGHLHTDVTQYENKIHSCMILIRTLKEGLLTILICVCIVALNEKPIN